MKTAVVLLNLGGPAREEDIAPFLFNFFRDKNVITLPNPLRYMLAHWISKTRSKGAAKKAYAPLGGKSPLLGNTQAQAQALQKVLGEGMRVFVSMRHWHPMSDEVARDVAAYQPQKIILLPLYPQFSTTTTLSALEDWQRAANKAGLTAPTETVCCYPADPGFVAASAALIRTEINKASGPVRLLFSAHGLPEKIIRKGDPYQLHCEKTAAAIAQALNIPGLDWSLCYQSRVGRLKWIGPSIGQEIARAAKDKTGVVIYPLAFVSEHVETLVELDIEYQQRAADLGITTYLRVPTVGTHPLFIEGLRQLALGTTRKRNCPATCSKCRYGENK
jgi:ferrochelatase